MTDYLMTASSEEPLPPLSEGERQRRLRLEREIEPLLDAYYAVGIRLREIRMNKLWRDDYASWEAYLKENKRFGEARAQHYINAADVTEELMGVVAITNERIAREFETTPPEQRRVVAELVVAFAASNQVEITSTLVGTIREYVKEAIATKGYVSIGETPTLLTTGISEGALEAHRANIENLIAMSKWKQRKVFIFKRGEREEVIDQLMMILMELMSGKDKQVKVAVYQQKERPNVKEGK